MSADGRRAVAGSWDKTLTVWDVENGRDLWTLKGHASGVAFVAMRGDGRLVVSRAWDVPAPSQRSLEDVLKVWDVESGKELWTLKGRQFSGFCGGGRWALFRSEEGAVEMWDIEHGECMAAFTGESAISCCAAASDGRTLVVGEQSGRIHFLRLVLLGDPVEKENSVGKTSRER
jgi:hypothetical protein